MNKLSALIVDDEVLARDLVKSYVDERPNIEIVGECSNGVDAINQIAEMNPDLVFLDVQMPGLDGFQVVKEIPPANSPYFIFITAFDKYAVKAFEINAIDYLLKPFDRARFDAALQRITERRDLTISRELNQSLETLVDTYTRSRPKPTRIEYERRILIKDSKKVFLLNVAEIGWIEASGDYVKIHAAAKSYLVNDSIHNFLTKLDPNQFVRIHRSTIINIDFVKELYPYFNGEYHILLNDGAKVKLSRSYKEVSKQIFGTTI